MENVPRFLLTKSSGFVLNVLTSRLGTRGSRELVLNMGGTMSEGFTPQSLGDQVPVVASDHERLRMGALVLIDIAAATMANIGPAMSFYFGFGFLALTAGLASPLTIIAAGVAILFLGNTLSEFTKVMPSTGGFISFIGKTFGARAGVTTAVV